MTLNRQGGLYSSERFKMRDYIYDIETYPNVFLLAIEHCEFPMKWCYEISDYRNDSQQIIELIRALKERDARMVGFNNLAFDYPVLHTLIKMGYSNAQALYNKAQAVINSQDNEKFIHLVKPSERFVDQLDLFKIHHFDNKARSTGLKELQFAMRSKSVQDLPFPVGSFLDTDQIQLLRKYVKHDVQETKRFYMKTTKMIQFREDLALKYPDKDWINFNDTKIGKEFFTMSLEKYGIQCYEFSNEGRKPKQTIRNSIKLSDAILPGINFKNPELQRVLSWLRSQTIKETKNVFDNLTATVDGFTFVFGLGGIHGSIENKIVEADEDNVILDLDVTSYYPNLAIVYQFYPKHLGVEFCSIYKELFEQRKKYSKNSTESAMLKLALNGVYGDSNNPFSVFYDPLFTMSITLNGQMLLCKLAEYLLQVNGLKIIQVNTDGITIKFPKQNEEMVKSICQVWQIETKLNLEEAYYKKMCIRDVNNYIAEYQDGKIKKKGAYDWEKGWHQNASALVIPKVAEKVLISNVNIRKTVESWSDIMDFMLLIKTPKNSRLILEDDNGKTTQVQNTTRYCVVKNGKKLFKQMPPLKNKTEWRKISVESGWEVDVFNDFPKVFNSEINFDYYVREVEKLCLSMS